MFLITIYYILLALIVAHIVVSWVPSAQWHPLGRVILLVSEPLLKPFRRLLPPVTFNSGVTVDFSPLLCILATQLVLYILTRLEIRF